MKITAIPQNDAMLIDVQERRIDAAIAVQFKDLVRSMIEGREGRILMNLSAVEFVDSSGLGAIVAAMKMTGKTGGLELVGLTPTVMRVFKLTRMDTIFPIHNNLPSEFEVPANAN